MLALQNEPKLAQPKAREFVPQLQNGDQLHSREFLRRYDRMPLVKKAELIEGVVFMGSPVSRQHGRPDIVIHAWLEAYSSDTPGTEALSNVTVILDPENTVQPDCFLRIIAPGKGSTKETDLGLISGPPELVVEIAASSASIDAHKKLTAYRRNGVAEYLLWRVDECRIEWLHLVDEEYLAAEPDAQGILRSRAFPGLQVSLPALLSLDSNRARASLEEGLASPAHAEFVRSLAAQ